MQTTRGDATLRDALDGDSQYGPISALHRGAERADPPSLSSSILVGTLGERAAALHNAQSVLARCGRSEPAEGLAAQSALACSSPILATSSATSSAKRPGTRSWTCATTFPNLLTARRPRRARRGRECLSVQLQKEHMGKARG